MIKKLCSSVLAVAIVMGSGVVASAAEPIDPYDITDIHQHWSFDSVADMMYAGILSGYEDHTFRPDKQVTRAEYLTALYRTAIVLDEPTEYMDNREELLEEYSTKNLTAPYQDLQGHWSKNAVAWVKNYLDKQQPGLMARVFPGKAFNPAQPITREEAAVISSAFLQAPVEDKSLVFTDITAGYTYQNEIKSLVNNGVINGYEDNTFRPKAPVTRGATAVILQKVMKDVNQRANFFAGKEYITAPVSTGDVDYIPTFLPVNAYDMTDGQYQPETEMDEQYLAFFNSIKFDELASWAQDDIISEMEEDGYEFDSAEWDAEFEKRVTAWEETQEAKKADIGYLTGEERGEMFRTMKDSNYWNKAAVYYYLPEFFPEEFDQEDSLLKAVEGYDINRNGADDLLSLYAELVSVYSDAGNKEQVLTYIKKATDLFASQNADKLTTLERDRFYLLAAVDLDRVGAYQEALAYIDLYLVNDEFHMSDEVNLEKYSLMYLNGADKNEVIAGLKASMKQLDTKSDYYVYLKDRYTWALKTIARGGK